MSGTIDWSGGPVACSQCHKMMRPSRRKAQGVWAGTVTHTSQGRCSSCVRADQRRVERASESAKEVIGVTEPPSGMRITRVAGSPVVVMDWLVPDGVPREHCRLEAIADLVVLLVSQGLVATGNVEFGVGRGGRVLRMRVPVRTMTLSERDVLARETEGD